MTWIEVNQLLDALHRDERRKGIQLSDLIERIETSEKKRREVVDGKLRAYYGHSIPRYIEKEKQQPQCGIRSDISNIRLGGNMRITEIDLQCEDIMWFGRDNQNHIFECTSAGRGNVPQFVCVSRENTEKLLNFFMYELAEFTKEKMLIECGDTNSLLEDCAHLSRKGIYCYDIYEDDEQQYIKISEPLKPLEFDSLPLNIKDIFENNTVNVNAMTDKFISVEHAY